MAIDMEAAFWRDRRSGHQYGGADLRREGTLIDLKPRKAAELKNNGEY